MKSDEEIMEILEAFDLTRSYRDAAELAGCGPPHHCQLGRTSGPRRADI